MIKIKAVEQKLMVGPKAGQYVYMLQRYNKFFNYAINCIINFC